MAETDRLARPRPRALLVTPILPAVGGNGLAMRAGLLLEALASEYAVTLLQIPVAGSGIAEEFTQLHAERHVVLPLAGALDPLFSLSASVANPAERFSALCAYPRPLPSRWATRPALEAAAALSRPAEVSVGPETAGAFAAIVVLRSYLAPYAAPFLTTNEGSLRVLDLDDDERLTHQRLSALSRLRGHHDAATLSAAEAHKYEALERQWVPRFDLVLAASELHRAEVMTRHAGVRAEILANSVTVTAPPATRASSSGLRILFVGNLSYEPNVDAAQWMVHDILPLLQRETALTEVRMAGSQPAPEVAALAQSGVEICADPADLAPHYAWTDIAVAPLRAGGGTRIKILEAFAAGVAVVATSIGAEGLAVRNGEHLLIADQPAAFAAACSRLAADPPLRRQLTASALELVRARYNRQNEVERLRRLFAASREPN
jgi:glycosyltransferase involved in cell wall biosynthesis